MSRRLQEYPPGHKVWIEIEREDRKPVYADREIVFVDVDTDELLVGTPEGLMSIAELDVASMTDPGERFGDDENNTRRRLKLEGILIKAAKGASKVASAVK